MAGIESFNIEQYKARFGDGAKASLFYYTPFWPPGISNIISGEDAMYLVKSATMPGSTRDEGTLNWQGFDYKYATKSTYGDITISFNVDINANIRLQFERWMNLIHNPVDNTYAISSLYMQNQTLQMVGYAGANIMEFTLHHAWPKEVAQISMDYSTSEVATFDVTFSYQYHTLSPSETGGIANLAGSIL